MKIKFFLLWTLIFCIHLLGMHEIGLPITVTVFRLTNDQEKKQNIIRTIFLLDHQKRGADDKQQRGYITSTETGLTYNLSTAHLEIIRQDWSNISCTRSLNNDYVMSTAMHKNGDDYIRVSINYNNYRQFPDQSSEAMSNHFYAIIQNKNKYKGKMILSYSGISKKRSIARAKITGISLIDPYAPKKRYIEAQIHDKTLLLPADKPYNNEGLMYEGSLLLTEDYWSDIVNKIKEEKRYNKTIKELFLHIEVEKNVTINVLVNVENIVREEEQTTTQTDHIGSNESWQQVCICGGAILLCTAGIIYLWKKSGFSVDLGTFLYSCIP